MGTHGEKMAKTYQGFQVSRLFDPFSRFQISLLLVRISLLLVHFFELFFFSSFIMKKKKLVINTSQVFINYIF